MSEQSSPTMTEEQLAERKELFRYTDMSHPLIACLFDIAPAELTQNN